MPTLTWLTRDEDLTRAGAAPYRLLEDVPELGAGDPASGNMLIQGDNLDALKALLPFYAGRVKCIYVDPPYNTRSAFDQYDDSLEHAQWLEMIYPRLVLLRELLATDGVIWVSIDDNEAHYLKVIMDEVFGRSKFVASIVWQKRYSRENRGAIGDAHEYLLVYALDPDGFKKCRNKLPLDEAQAKIYKNPDDPSDKSPERRWRGLPMTAQGFRPNQMYEITSPTGKRHRPPAGRCWSMIEPEFRKLEAEKRIYWGKDGNAQPSVIRFLSEVEGIVPWTWWTHQEVGHTDESKKEVYEIFGTADAFDTPKPERLVWRILHISSNPGDLVLDSFLGSGTTAAVAHKMGRRWIGVEVGDHAQSHCAPRLKKVIEGEQGGVSEAVGWKGGGGFRFFRLGPPVFNSDGAINPGIPFAHLAAHVWFSETGSPLGAQPAGAWLGTDEGRGLVLLYNGILGDKSVSGGNVLTAALLKKLRADAGGFTGPLTIYGEASRLGPDRLKAEGVTFKQTPYDVRAR